MSVKLFKQFIEKYNIEDVVLVKSKKGAHTAEEAANVHGVPISNIVKSLVVKADEDFIIVLCPGDKRIKIKTLRDTLGKESVQMANASDVKNMTGHSIGGVPPFGHKQPLRTIIIEGFDSSEPLWAAAGAADANFQTTLSKMEEIVERVNNMLG